jgi:hypothetical protein
VNRFKRFFPEKGPVRKDDMDFTGTKREKILDFGPIRGKTADEGLLDIMLNEHNASRTSKGGYATQLTGIYFLRWSRALRSSMSFGLPAFFFNVMSV